MINAGDTSLMLEIYGEGEPIIFVHGGPGGNYYSFRKLIGKLPNYKLVFYDQRGSGESRRFKEPKPEDFTIQKHLEDIEHIRKYLGVDKFYLLGHSWGGALVSFYAEAYPERVRKLFIYSGGPETKEMANKKHSKMMMRLSKEANEKFSQYMAELNRLVESKSSCELLDENFDKLIQVIAPALEKDVKNSKREIKGRGGFWASQFTNLYQKNFDRVAFLKKLKAFKKPVLITYGEYEPSPINRFTDLHEAFLNSKLFKFENSGHQALFEEHDKFIEIFLSFLNSNNQ